MTPPSKVTMNEVLCAIQNNFAHKCWVQWQKVRGPTYISQFQALNWGLESGIDALLKVLRDISNNQKVQKIQSQF